MTDMRTQIAAATFFPVPGGYLFREPYRWAFADAPHYLVSDQQKDDLLAITVPRRPVLWQAGLWGALCAMVTIAGVAVWAVTRHDNPTIPDTLAMIALTLAQMLVALLIVRWWKLRQLRPLLVGLPLTDLRITRSQMQQAGTDTMSLRQLIFVATATAMTCAALLMSAIIFLMLGRSVGFMFLSGGLFFATLMIVHVRRLIARVEKAA